MENKCQKCNHKWMPRIMEEPKQCPRCKNYNWKFLNLSGGKEQ